MLILITIYTLATLGLIIFDLLFLLRLPFYQHRESDHREPVSVIICARNEAENLRRVLPLMLAQDFDRYEVIIVDDASTDDTPDLLVEFSRQHSELRVIRIETDDPRAAVPGKKVALGMGIAAAAFDILLLTDADCQPSSRDWISGMSAQFGQNKIVLGYSPFITKNNLAAWLSTWDNFETAMLYFGFALAGIPYMGVGRNLAYRKSLYLQNRPLGHDAGLASGDDDLQVGAMADPRITAIELKRPHRTYSEPSSSIKHWWNQKRRHLTTAVYYQPLVRLLLAFYGVAKLLFYTLLAGWLISDGPLWLILLAVGRLLLHYLVVFSNATRLQQWELLLIYPFWEFLTTFLHAIIHLTNFFKAKKEAWN